MSCQLPSLAPLVSLFISPPNPVKTSFSFRGFVALRICQEYDDPTEEMYRWKARIGFISYCIGSVRTWAISLILDVAAWGFLRNAESSCAIAFTRAVSATGPLPNRTLLYSPA